MAPDGTRGAFKDVGGNMTENLATYTAGAKDENRPWGAWYAVSVKTNTVKGMNIVSECEKDIHVKPSPKGVLSLQMHEGREEYWTVKEGTLTVIMNGNKIKVNEGQTLHIPRGAIHCMVNETKETVIVHEIQKGTCQEKDNWRISDAHKRADGGITPDVELVNVMIKTLKDRYEQGDYNPEDGDLLHIYQEHKNNETKMKERLLETLAQSRKLYEPYVAAVLEVKCGAANENRALL